MWTQISSTESPLISSPPPPRTSPGLEVNTCMRSFPAGQVCATVPVSQKGLAGSAARVGHCHPPGSPNLNSSPSRSRTRSPSVPKFRSESCHACQRECRSGRPAAADRVTVTTTNRCALKCPKGRGPRGIHRRADSRAGRVYRSPVCQAGCGTPGRASHSPVYRIPVYQAGYGTPGRWYTGRGVR